MSKSKEFINKVRLCSDAAAVFVEGVAEALDEESSVYKDDTDYVYTEKYQEYFNLAYDKLWEALEEFEHENK